MIHQLGAMCALLGLASASEQNHFALFQPSEGLRSGKDFETSLKLPRSEGWRTEKVSVQVPQGIQVRPAAKPGWRLRWDASTLLFEADEAVDSALEFQLHLVAGCDFSNASEATLRGLRHVLLWQTIQHLKALNGTEMDCRWTDAEVAPFLEVSSDQACGASVGPGMLWLGEHVPAQAKKNELEEKVVGLEEDRAFDGHDFLKPHESRRNGRHGVQAGMAFGRPDSLSSSKKSFSVHLPVWKVLGLLCLIMLVLFLGTLLMGFTASAWAHLLMSSSRQSALKDHLAKESCSRGLEEAHLIENNVLGKRSRSESDRRHP